MTILLIVLKIIGCILLILLLLILTLLLLILFFPVTYQIRASYHKKLTARIRTSWLFRLISLHVDYQSDEIIIYAYLFGWKKKLMGGEAEQVEQELEEEAEEALSDSQFIEDAEQATGISDLSDAKKEADMVKEESGFVKKEDQKGNGHHAKEHRTGIFSQIWGMIENIYTALKKIKTLITDEQNQAAFSHLRKEIFYLLKIVRPKKMKLNAQYSTGSPDTTGKVLGILAIFPAAYRNGWNIAPDFASDQFYVELDTNARGRLFFIQLVRMGIRIFSDKNCRRLYNHVK